MGNSANGQEQPGFVMAQDDTNFKEMMHPQLAQAKLVVDQEGKQHLQIRLPNQQQLTEWMIGRSQLNHRKYLFLPHVISQQEADMCGQRLVAVLNYDFYPFCLDREIEMRRVIRRQFDEVEIWYLMYTGATAAYHFQRINLKMGNISPTNILINRKGHVRYVNRFSWPGEYPRTKSRSPTDCYLAPEELNNNAQFDKHKADCFGVGVVMLQLLLMTEMGAIYSRAPGFDYHQFAELKKKVLKDQRYSRFLIEVLLEMTDIDTAARPRPSTILTWLQPYQKDIVRFRKFQRLPPA